MSRAYLVHERFSFLMGLLLLVSMAALMEMIGYFLDKDIQTGYGLIIAGMWLAVAYKWTLLSDDEVLKLQ